ncbi:hypothetical protein QYF36_015398 [Acer negundo]|nr:hypothetical protein QYF36_015398 [Acer negundo]
MLGGLYILGDIGLLCIVAWLIRYNRNLVVHGSVPGSGREIISLIFGEGRTPSARMTNQLDHGVVVWNPPEPVLEGYLQVPVDTTNRMAMVAGSSSSSTAAAAVLLAHPHHPHQATTTKSWCDEEYWRELSRSSSSSRFDEPTSQPDGDDMMLPFEDNCHTPLWSNNFLP